MSMKQMNKLMKQAKKMEKDMLEQQSKVHEASAGGGAVVVQVNGKFEIVSITISKECIDPSDPEMLQDLVKAAVNEAVKKAQDAAEEQLSALKGALGGMGGLGGMGFPGM
jgi:DNA-binding YbaB/EbfC family protein